MPPPWLRSPVRPLDRLSRGGGASVCVFPPEGLKAAPNDAAERRRRRLNPPTPRDRTAPPRRPVGVGRGRDCYEVHVQIAAEHAGPHGRSGDLVWSQHTHLDQDVGPPAGHRVTDQRSRQRGHHVRKHLADVALVYSVNRSFGSVSATQSAPSPSVTQPLTCVDSTITEPSRSRDRRPNTRVRHHRTTETNYVSGRQA